MPSSRNADVSRALDSIVMKALAKNQLNRYQSAGDMRSDLQRALADQPVIAEAVMTDAERTQFIARTPPPVVPRREVYDDVDDHRRRNALIWVAVVVALLLVIGVASFVLFGTSHNNAPKKVAVADVTGQVPAAAVQTLKKQGFVPQAGDPTYGPCTNGASVSVGSVCTTNPGADKMIAVGTTIIYRTYQKQKVQVPPVTNMDYTSAAEALNKLGLKPQQKNVNNADKKGTVEAQSVAAYSVIPKGTTVVLSVSTGTIKLPNVKGMDYQEALARLSSALFTNVHKGTTTRETSDPSKDGEVAAESPKSGKAYQPDQYVVLTVYEYVQPQPTCTTPPPSTPGVPPTSGLPTGSSSSSTTTDAPLPACSTTPTPGTGTPSS